jgi:hypothetical protein
MNSNESNAGWLMFAIRVGQYQWERDLLTGVIESTGGLVRIAGGADPGGADPADPADPDDDLRRSVRERLADGRLFRASGMSVARRGTARDCIVCGRAIDKSTVEREVEERGIVAIAHDDCYRIWREESRRRAE